MGIVQMTMGCTKQWITACPRAGELHGLTSNVSDALDLYACLRFPRRLNRFMVADPRHPSRPVIALSTIHPVNGTDAGNGFATQDEAHAGASYHGLSQSSCQKPMSEC